MRLTHFNVNLAGFVLCVGSKDSGNRLFQNHLIGECSKHGVTAVHSFPQRFSHEIISTNPKYCTVCVFTCGNAETAALLHLGCNVHRALNELSYPVAATYLERSWASTDRNWTLPEKEMEGCITYTISCI